MFGEPPLPWIVVGGFLAGLGGALLPVGEAVTSVIGVVMLAVGGLVLQITVFAAGVTSGLKRCDTLKAKGKI